MLNTAIERKCISGFKCIRFTPIISHLFFTDDSLLFSKASCKECVVLRGISDNYMKAFGQVVNFNKSDICVSKSTSKCSLGSVIWNGLLWEKKILVAGSRWRIRDGSSVSIYEDRWVPRPSTFRIFSPPKFGVNTLVSALITDSGGWNVPLVRESFLPEDAEAILSMPFGTSQSTDSLIWHYENYGTYSVRSGYKIGCHMAQPDSSSGLNSLESWWKAL
ncbi:hypothetical protein Ddye_029038 [Dipteronia dyeriana]|uniref:Uncharacterized protein n=1 Tax=Dipteronia dyeriana TaxID=168575 RepID=A0AAD9WK85_9ROSI|nr:hypothetical protein Ddye_029038 [Dipteronia dyeriana]